MSFIDVTLFFLAIVTIPIVIYFVQSSAPLNRPIYIVTLFIFYLSYPIKYCYYRLYIFKGETYIYEPNHYFFSLDSFENGLVLSFFFLFYWVVLGFVYNFAMARFISLQTRFMGSGASERTTKSTYIFCIIILSIAAAVVMVKTGVGKMGIEITELPFKLTGILFYSCTLVIPYAMLREITAQMTCSYHKLDAKYNNLLITTFVLFIITISIHTGSRSLMIYSIIQLVICYFIINEINIFKFMKEKVLQVITSLVLLYLLYHLISFSRLYFINLGDFGVSDYFALVDKSFFFSVINRLLGITQLSTILEFSNINNELLNELGLAKYYTKEVLKHGAIFHSSSPGYLGSHYLLFGSYSAFVAAVYFYFLLFIYNLVIVTGTNEFKVTICSFLVVIFFHTITDGILEQEFFKVFLVLLCAYIYELFVVRLSNRQLVKGR